MTPDEDLPQTQAQAAPYVLGSDDAIGANDVTEETGEMDHMPSDESRQQNIPMRREPAELGLGLLEDIELDATLQFGSRDMVLREVLELGPGDVIELDRHVSEPVDLVVGDRIVARGEVVVANGNFALRITEVATPQLRLESIRCLF